MEFKSSSMEFRQISHSYVIKLIDSVNVGSSNVVKMMSKSEKDAAECQVEGDFRTLRKSP